ncbi:hypothetical protein [Aquibacillus sediminis]|uniref:hypothetical protein n=1 Tax=Aquibacillus sediminis TaxID=2574734 RepID=UPI0011092F0E|nr:hypothetical protein [Aquibacillus sediminis]
MIERFLRSPFTVSVFLIGLAVIYTVGSQMPDRNGLFLLVSGLYGVFVVVYFGLIIYFNRKYPNRRIRIMTYIPYELKEEDEGHQYVTYRACRKVYIYYYFAIPVALVILILFNEIRLLPIFLLTGLGLGQYFIFWSEIKKLND